MNIFSKTDVGLVREINQDSLDSGQLPDGSVWAVVCDGMGGACGGDVASKMACEIFSKRINSSCDESMSGKYIKNMLISAVLAANSEIYDRSKSDKTLSGMGTTIVGCVVMDNVAHIVHAGDSRAYLIDGDGCKQLTTDHSVVQEWVDSGKITQEEARTHSSKNIITRALGVNYRLDVDYTAYEMSECDMLLMCTDGLSNYFTDGKIFSIVKGVPPEDICEKLVTAANDAGGSDNIAVVVIAQNCCRSEIDG